MNQHKENRIQYYANMENADDSQAKSDRTSGKLRNKST